MLCPIDPAQIDPYKPDVIFPGWVSADMAVAAPAHMGASRHAGVHGTTGVIALESA